jgi:hypothetical protein
MAKKEGKRGRKIGNNKEACKQYTMRGRLERNKQRNKARALRQEERARIRQLNRISEGKTYKVSKTAKHGPKVILLPDVSTLEHATKVAGHYDGYYPERVLVGEVFKHRLVEKVRT